MSELIEVLLDLSRLGRGDLHRNAVDLSGTAGDIAENLKKAQPDRNAEFAITAGLTAAGDERLLRVALENLLGNAWKFTCKKSGCRIEFGALERGMRNSPIPSGQTPGKMNNTPAIEQKTIYYVRDDGAGFDMTYAGKLFTPFQRLHTTQEFPGTGIGLATVQRIIHCHGGKVWAEGEPGKGATVYFTLG
jgi:light-regulated signal transduction histidine kinase (bacteriophytochrome)